MTRIPPMASLALTLPLIACGAGSDRLDQIVLDSGQAALLAEADAAVLSAAQTADRSTNVPRSTVVTYNGTFTGQTQIAGRLDQTMVADMALTADFGTDQLSGTLRDFTGTDISGRSRDFTGSLLLDGDIDRDGDAAQVTMDALGTLTDSAGRDVDYDLDLTGDFRGDDADFILGTATGDITTSDGTGGAALATFGNGAFVAER